MQGLQPKKTPTQGILQENLGIGEWTSANAELERESSKS